MSVRLMSQIWDMDFSPVEKLVLLALADWANDDGLAWPSIRQLAAKTGCGERTVQRTLRDAEKRGLLTRHEVTGRGCSYTINPRHCGTPAKEAPVPENAQTPATVAPNTLVNTTSQKTTSSSKARVSKSRFVLPDDIPADEWADYEEMRKLIRKPMSDSIREKAITRLRKLAEDGYPPGVVLSHSTLNNYQGLFAPKDFHDGRKPNSGTSRSRSGLVDALRRSQAEERSAEDQDNDPGAWLALPSSGNG